MATHDAANGALLLLLLGTLGSALAAGLPDAPALAAARGDRALDFAKVCELSRVDRASTRSERCLGCHDGTTAPAVAHGSLGDERSHPVGIDFDVARARRPGLLHAKASLPAALALPEGEVRCTTCHDGASARSARLALTMRGSSLCLACHDR